MKKLILFSILAFVFNVFAQNVTEINLVHFSQSGGICEATTIPNNIFNALKKVTVEFHLGKISSIIRTIHPCTYLIMTSEEKFFIMDYDYGKKKAICTNMHPLTKGGDLDQWSGISWERYIIKNPECRIPNEIPNSKNTLSADEDD
jgi:hypothetical protein